MNFDIVVQGPDLKPYSLIAPDAKLVNTLSQMEACGRLMAATERPETLPAETPEMSRPKTILFF